MLQTLWEKYVTPILRRPMKFQVAALCYRLTDGRPEIVMITSLETHRWILPKGWPKDNHDASEMALQEAWEEAGVKPRAGKPPLIGQYQYMKKLEGGIPVATEVNVYAVEVEILHDVYPEAPKRERRWMKPVDAAAAVDEPDLKVLIRKFAESLNGSSGA